MIGKIGSLKVSRLPLASMAIGETTSMICCIVAASFITCKCFQCNTKSASASTGTQFFAIFFSFTLFQCSVHFLKTNKNASDPEWLSKLPQLVKHLEVGLYMSAPSFNFYRDVKTLKSRLEQLTRKFKLWKWAQDRRKRNGWISK